MDGNGYINGYGYGLMSDAVDEVLPLHCNDLDDGVLGSIPVQKKEPVFLFQICKCNCSSILFLFIGMSSKYIVDILECTLNQSGFLFIDIGYHP